MPALVEEIQEGRSEGQGPGQGLWTVVDMLAREIHGEAFVGFGIDKLRDLSGCCVENPSEEDNGGEWGTITIVIPKRDGLGLDHNGSQVKVRSGEILDVFGK